MIHTLHIYIYLLRYVFMVPRLPYGMLVDKINYVLFGGAIPVAQMV